VLLEKKLLLLTVDFTLQTIARLKEQMSLTSTISALQTTNASVALVCHLALRAGLWKTAWHGRKSSQRQTSPD
jgi:hypothetical protein